MTSSEFAVLSLIVEQPRHGYDIEQIIDERGMREWTEIGFSSIYYVLKNLEKKKLITGRTENAAGRGPARKVYHAVPAGVDACRRATVEALETPHRYYAPIQLGLANLPNVPVSEAVEALKRHHRGLIERLTHIQNTRDKQRPLPDFVEAMFDHSLTMVEAEKEWIKNQIQRMEQQMPKVDFKKELKQLYGPSAKGFVVVDAPEMNFLMVDGHGDPNTEPEYVEAIEALYSLSYKIKFMSKSDLDKDYVVPPLEGLWWAEDMNAFVLGKKDEWNWTMMIMQPNWITREMFEEGFAAVKKAKNPPALSKIRLESYHEGLSVQILYIGPYADEASTLVKMHTEFIPDGGYTMSGKHHEIYLSDPRRVAPEKLKTVLRQPVKKV